MSKLLIISAFVLLLFIPANFSYAQTNDELMEFYRKVVNEIGDYIPILQIELEKAGKPHGKMHAFDAILERHADLRAKLQVIELLSPDTYDPWDKLYLDIGDEFIKVLKKNWNEDLVKHELLLDGEKDFKVDVVIDNISIIDVPIPLEDEPDTIIELEPDEKKLEFLDEVLELNPDYLKIPFTDDVYSGDLDIVPDGDPLAFSIDGDTCTIRREMGSHESTYWSLNLYSTNPPINLNMNRNLCDGTYILGIDRNNNNILDSGYELLWLQEFDAFQLLHNVDYYEGVHDGFFDANDPLWKDALVMDSKYNYYHPEELGIKAVSYYADVQRFENDKHGVGVYADEVDLSSHHFRIIAHNPTGIIFDDDSTTELFGIVEGPLWDCTIHDVRYHIAEKMTGLYLRSENPEDSTQLYIDALDFCDDFETAHKHPDKYLSHWVAGIASMQHKKGLTDFNMLLQSKGTYEEALAMSPDNPFYNVDYCLVNRQLGLPTDECIPKVQQAIEQRSDVDWFQQVHVILTGDVY